jgi:hypothetical protein
MTPRTRPAKTREPRKNAVVVARVTPEPHAVLRWNQCAAEGCELDAVMIVMTLSNAPGPHPGTGLRLCPDHGLAEAQCIHDDSPSDTAKKKCQAKVEPDDVRVAMRTSCSTVAMRFSCATSASTRTANDAPGSVTREGTRKETSGAAKEREEKQRRKAWAKIVAYVTNDVHLSREELAAAEKELNGEKTE